STFAAAEILLFRNPGDNKAATGKRGDGGRALVVGNELVDLELSSDFLTGWSKNLTENIAHTPGAGLIEAGPNDGDVAIVENRDRWGGLGLTIGTNGDLGRGPGVAGGQKARVNTLETGAATLPDENSPAVFEKGDLGILLITRTEMIDAESR